MSVSQKDLPDPDALQKALLTGDGKWWEFLDPATNAIQPMPESKRQSSEMLDWSKVRTTQRRVAVGFGAFHRCDSCGSPCPPDMSFCARCGGHPKGTGLQQRYSLIIKEFGSDAALISAAEIISEAGVGLGLNEVVSMLRQPPAVFNLTTYRERAAGLVQSLAEHGAYAKTFSVDDPGVPWFGETLESVIRAPKQLGIFGGAILGTVLLMAFVGWPALFAGIAVLAFLFHRRLLWYREHYVIDASVIMDRLVGFEEGRAEQAARVLHGLRDPEMKRLMSVCVMEYYSLHKLFQAHEGEWSEVLLPSHHALKELIDQIISSAQKYIKLENALIGMEPSEASYRLAEISSLSASADPRTRQLLADEARHIERSLAHADRLPAVKETFTSQLRTMAASLEAMRQRVNTLIASNQMDTEVSMEAILKELDRELEIFEETVVSMR